MDTQHEEADVDELKRIEEAYVEVYRTLLLNLADALETLAKTTRSSVEEVVSPLWPEPLPRQEPLGK